MPQQAPLLYFCTRQGQAYRDNAYPNSDGT